MAQAAGLGQTAARRSSRGICFVGPRDFGAFMAQYVEPVSGLLAIRLCLQKVSNNSSLCKAYSHHPLLYPRDLLPQVPGQYVDVDSGRALGPCPDMLPLTVGQRARLAGSGQGAYYVAGG